MRAHLLKQAFVGAQPKLRVVVLQLIAEPLARAFKPNDDHWIIVITSLCQNSDFVHASLCVSVC